MKSQNENNTINNFELLNEKNNLTNLNFYIVIQPILKSYQLNVRDQITHTNFILGKYILNYS